MSLYGLERRTNFSPFQFDKIYSSRAEMEDQCSDDGIYIGRYVLISYGEDEFIKDPQYTKTKTKPLFVTQPNINGKNNFDYSDTSSDLHSISISSEQILSEQIIATKSDKDFQENLKTDLERYGNSYHNTVWMKVYRNAAEEYIMIAELNAKAPQLGIEVEDPAIKSFTQADSGKITTETTETWQEPYFDLTKSSDLYYTLKMPKTHQYKTGAPEFKEEGFNSDVRSPELASPTEQLANLDAANNKIYWQFFSQNGLLTDNAGTKANGKQLFMNLPAFGQLASILYDLLLGIPYTGNTRPYSFDEFDFSNLLGEFSYEGLLKFLQTLFADGSFGMADWTAPVRAPGYIKNKPYVIDTSDNGDRKLTLHDSSPQSTVYS